MLSIIIPTLNEEKYLLFLLESLRKQNFKNYEVIIADANSTDKTLEVARKYNCKIIGGGYVARGRNEGAKVAKGNLFLFLDADIILSSPYFLEKLLREFEKRKLDVASFPIYPLGKINKIAYGIYNFWVKISQHFLPHATEAVLVRREMHEKIGGFDEMVKIAEDHDYARRAGKTGKFGFIEAPPLLTSPRRFERDGMLKTYLIYILSGIYILIFGPVKSNIFKYKFDIYSEKTKE